MLNVFEGDLFSTVSLTAYINSLPYVPQQLGEWFDWNVQGEDTDKLLIERQVDGSLALIEEQPRGTLGSQIAREDRDGFLVKVPHYPQFETLMAASVQNVRAFGSENQLEGVEMKRNGILTKMHAKNQLMWEFIRAGAIQGIIYKASGGVSQNLHTLFGTTPNTHDIDLADPTTEIVAELIEAKEKGEDELGAYQGLANGWTLVCGKNIHRKFTYHKKVQDGYDRWNQGSFHRDDHRKGFPIASDINVVSYSKGKIGSTMFIDPDTAYLCPNVAGLYQTRFAPGDSMEVVNTIGVPEYSSSHVLPHGKGVELYTETNCVSFVERPRAIVRIRQSA